MDQPMDHAPLLAAPPSAPLASDDDPKGTTTAPPALIQSHRFCTLLAQAAHWSGPLVCDHLTSQDRLALFSTCRGASRTVLSTAQHASIRLHVSHSTSMGQLLAIKGAMQARGQLRTKLDFTASHPPLIPLALGSLGPLTWLDELTVEVQQPPDMGPADRHVPHVPHVAHLPADTLASIGGCCPNLRVLSLRTPLQGLPPPQHLPNLEELLVHLPPDYAAMECLVRIISLHVKQLAVLRVSGCLMPPALLPVLLSPDSVGTRLHTLELHLQPGPIMGAAALEQHFNVRLRDLITEGSNWSCTLVTDHLDPEARLALYRTCRGSRRLVLEAAEHATIRLRVTPQHLVPLKLAGLLDTKSALQVRGRLPTKLHLSTTTAPLMAIMLGLMGRLEWLSDVALEVKREQRDSVPYDELPITVLTDIARCCPNLRALDVRSSSQRLPGPDLLPSLRELAVRWPFSWRHHGHPDHMQHVLDEGLARTIVPFLPQLTHFGVDFAGSMPPSLRDVMSPANGEVLLPMMLNPGSIGARIRVLHLGTALDDRLLNLLLGCALTLDELEVNSVQLLLDTHARTPAPWRRLQLRGRLIELFLSSLLRLPVAPAMEFVCSCERLLRSSCLCVICDITSEQAAAVPAPYRALRFITHGGTEPRTQYLNIEASHNLNAAHHPDALRAGLSLTRGWGFAPNITPFLWSLSFSPMTAQLLQELRGLPRWSCLRLCSSFARLPVAQLHLLLRLLPSSFRLVVINYKVGGYPSGYSIEQVESLCLGAPTNRTAETPLHIALEGDWDEVAGHSDEMVQLVQAIRHKMGLDGSRPPAEPCPYPHVTIEREWVEGPWDFDV